MIGALVDAGVLEQRVLEVLRSSDTDLYLRHAEQQAGKAQGYLGPLQSFGVVSEYDRFPEDHLPAVIVATPGILEEPEHDSEGYYRATWALEVSVTATGSNPVDARRRSQLYAAAIRGLVLQVPLAAPGFKASVRRWMDESYTDVPTSKRRSILATSNVFAVEVEDVVSLAGTAVPPDSEGWLITEVDVDIERVEDVVP